MAEEGGGAGEGDGVISICYIDNIDGEWCVGWCVGGGGGVAAEGAGGCW